MGANQTGKVAGNVITLTGRHRPTSTDRPCRPLTYTWAQVANGAPTVTLSDTHTIKPTFTAPPATAGVYTVAFTVTVDDGSVA